MRPSTVYAQVPLKFAIQPPKLFMEPFKNLRGPFRNDVWIAIFVIFIIAVFATFSLKFVPSNFRRFMIGGCVNRTPILNMWNILLGNVVVLWNGSDRRGLSNFAKTVFIFWSLGWLIVRGSYQGSLYDSLRHEEADTSLDTIRKIFESDCVINIIIYAVDGLKDFGLTAKSSR